MTHIMEQFNVYRPKEAKPKQHSQSFMITPHETNKIKNNKSSIFNTNANFIIQPIISQISDKEVKVKRHK